jgi:hypothetical protein
MLLWAMGPSNTCGQFGVSKKSYQREQKFIVKLIFIHYKHNI